MRISSLINKNIYLTGFMGCGKSHVGRELAKILNRKFIDTDKLILDKAGLTINEIFAKYGEAHFRALEHEIIASLHHQANLIVSLGGGAIMDKANQAILKTGLWIFINTPYDVIVERTSHNHKRPLARDPKKMAALYAERLPAYGLAEVIISGERESAVVVKRIIEKIEK